MPMSWLRRRLLNVPFVPTSRKDAWLDEEHSDNIEYLQRQCKFHLDRAMQFERNTIELKNKKRMDQARKAFIKCKQAHANYERSDALMNTQIALRDAIRSGSNSFDIIGSIKRSVDHLKVHGGNVVDAENAMDEFNELMTDIQDINNAITGSQGIEFTEDMMDEFNNLTEPTIVDEFPDPKPEEDDPFADDGLFEDEEFPMVPQPRVAPIAQRGQ